MIVFGHKQDFFCQIVVKKIGFDDESKMVFRFILDCRLNTETNHASF